MLRPSRGGGRGQEGAKTESGDRETNTERQTGDSIYMGRYKSVTFVASLFWTHWDQIVDKVCDYFKTDYNLFIILILGKSWLFSILKITLCTLSPVGL